MRTHNPRLFYTIIMLLAVIFWSSAFVEIRVALHHGFHPGSLAFFRYGVAAVVLLIFCAKRIKPKNKLSIKEWIFAIVVGLMGIAIYSVCLNIGELRVSAGISAFLISQESVLMLLFCMWFFKEKTSLLAWFGIILSVFGIALIAWSKSHNIENLYAVFWVMGATICAALYSVLQRRVVPKIGSIQFIMYAIISSAILLSVIFLPQFIRDSSSIDGIGYSAAIYLAVVPGILGYWLLSVAAPNLPIGHVAAMLFLIPVFTTLMGAFILGEIPVGLALDGAVITLIGAIWTQYANKA